MAIWGRLKKYLLRWPLYFILIVFPILIGGAHYVRSEVYQTRMLQMLEKTLSHWPKFVEDLKILDTQTITRPITRNQNAAMFLSERLTWNPFEQNPTDAQLPAMLAKDLIGKYAKWDSDPSELAKLLADPDLKKIDTSWVRELSRFDHIDLSVTKNQTEHLNRLAQANVLDRISIIASLPIPEYKQALDLATVSVLQAHLANASSVEMLSSLADLETLFHLLQSSPTLVEQMLAVATLSRKQNLIEALKIQGATFVPREMLLRLRRVAWMWASVINLSSMQEFEPALAEVRPFMKTKNFFCGGSDPISTHLLFKSVLLTKWPFAPNYEPAISREVSYIREAAAICGIPMTETLLSLPDPENNPIELSIPYWGGIYFSILNSISMASYFKPYDGLGRETNGNRGGGN